MKETDYRERIEIVIKWLNRGKENLNNNWEVVFNNITSALIELKSIQESMNKKEVKE